MALSVKGLVLYNGANQGPWNVQAEDKSIVDVRDELNKIVLGLKTRAFRRMVRKETKSKLKLLSGKLVHIELTDDGEVMVKEQEPLSV